MIKLPRETAIFEFSASNGYASFTLDYECLDIKLIEDGDQNHFSYLITVPIPDDSLRVDWNDSFCFERTYEKWEKGRRCISTLQGRKCSLM